ncbi:MAG: hypothetical protein ABR592_00585 [Nitriliruptorales bacterium]
MRRSHDASDLSPRQLPLGEQRLGDGHEFEHPRRFQQHAGIAGDQAVLECQQQLQGQPFDDLHHPGALHPPGQVHRPRRGLLHVP